MREGLKNRLAAAIACLAILLVPGLAAASEPGPLVGVPWLLERLGREDILVLDASPAKLHGAGHIPGAVNVDVFGFGGREVPAAQMQQRIQSWGVGEGKRIVVYDQGGSYFATSLLYDLYYHGVPIESLAVLDGGFAKWTAAGGAITREATVAPAPGTIRLGKPREEARVRLAEFLAGSGDPQNHALIEALEPAHHFGGARFFDRAGHVPHAIMMPAPDFFNADKTFKSPGEIRRMLDYLGVKPAQQVYAHCGGGIAASVPFFALKFLLGYPAVKLYKESQLEWLRDDRGLPFWTYDAPQLVREKAWLSGWGSPMMRSFGVSRLSIVDVRAPEAFRQAHLPFALPVPADAFRRHLASPAALAEVLAAAGVDAADEAVIVSDGGVNPASALAFLALERLGQRRVSILADSVDDWGFAGLALEKPADAAQATKPVPGPARTPKPYPLTLRPGLLIDDAQGTRGAYAKVYLASGRSLPARVPDGQVVHVPYTDLLEAGGRPKPAKDIWALLAKAGVPRYAEIIAIADDPGEAAANYFILKLMGFPDIKVLAP